MTCYFCQKRVTRRTINNHHPVLKSAGGDETVIAHKRCHVAHHSGNGDFAKFGRRGGRSTAQQGYYLLNLKRGARKPGLDDVLRFAINPS